MFRRRDLSGVDQVYLRADGIHVTIRLEEHKPCEVVMVGEGSRLHQDTDQGVRLLASPVVLMAICPTCPGPFRGPGQALAAPRAFVQENPWPLRGAASKDENLEMVTVSSSGSRDHAASKVGRLHAVLTPLGASVTGPPRSAVPEVKVHMQTLGHGGALLLGSRLP
jgi:hypothetical protein